MSSGEIAVSPSLKDSKSMPTKRWKRSPSRETALEYRPSLSMAQTAIWTARPATAFPGGGAIVVRVSPISGFQGLMRVQDAIANLGGVREAAVEAYARGEAQLRVALTDELTPERLTKALTDGLGQEARIESASVNERTMRVTLA